MISERSSPCLKAQQMREGAFAGLPSSVCLVHLSEEADRAERPREQSKGEASLSGTLIKRGLR